MIVELPTVLSWLLQGTELFTARVDELGNEDFARASLLPGWSRAHVVTHVARNAEALSNLVRWAATGIETPMYASPGQREADIANGATRPVGDIRTDLVRQVRYLADALDALHERSWQARVRTARGREIPASAIPWLRVREVWIHAVDLDAGATFEDLPAGLTHELLSDVTADLGGRDDSPVMSLVADGTVCRWHVKADDRSPAPTTVRGPAPTLLAWVLGRGTDHPLRTSGPAVTVPRWL